MANGARHARCFFLRSRKRTQRGATIERERRPVARKHRPPSHRLPSEQSTREVLVFIILVLLVAALRVDSERIQQSALVSECEC